MRSGAGGPLRGAYTQDALVPVRGPVEEISLVSAPGAVPHLESEIQIPPTSPMHPAG